MRKVMLISATLFSMFLAMLFVPKANGQTQRELDDIQYINLGENSAKRGDLSTAVSHFRKAIELNPENPRARDDLGKALGMMGKYDEAISQLSKSIELSPRVPYAYVDRGITYMNKGNIDSALLDFEKAIGLNPQPGAASFVHVLRGRCFFGKKDYTNAAADFNKAIELDPRNKGAYQGLGATLYALGMHGESITMYDRALKGLPGDPELLFGRANAYIKMGNYDKAIADYSAAITANPRYFGAYLNRAIAYDNKKQYDLALIDYGKAIEINPSHRWAYGNRGHTWRKKGEYRKAVEDFNKAIEIRPYPNAYWGRAKAWEKMGQYDRAIADYEKALEMLPRYAAAMADLAKLLATCPVAKHREGNKALKLANAAVELDLSAGNLSVLAAAEAEVGNFKKAVDIQKKAVLMLEKDGDKDSLETSRKWLEAYESKKPRRE
jgi:tetratricopeptide (TPR) repeat protein